jgi:uncharacterized membrane protein
MIGPGLLLAATGVGAGDLATASFVGGLLGTAVLWAVIFGAFLKFVVTEGLARWQLATGETLIEGAVIFGAVGRRPFYLRSVFGPDYPDVQCWHEADQLDRRCDVHYDP